MKKTPTGLVLAVLLLSGGVGAQRAPQQDVDLQAAIRTETVDGDLRGAIEQYKKVANGSDRTIAVRALLRMAGCYQKIGDAEARRVYERVVREFTDEKEAVTFARAQLGSTEAAGAPATMVSRRVWALAPPEWSLSGSISPDGRFLSYQADTALALRELATGRDRLLTDRTPSGFAQGSAISRDGGQLAYTWSNFDTTRNELRVMSLAGAGVPQSRLVFDNEEVAATEPFDWSPDGKWIAVQLTRRDTTRQMGLIAVADGSLRVLKSSDWRGATELFFSPDGKYLGFDLPVGETTNGQRDVFILAVDGSRQISAVVSASNDTMMGWSPDGKHLLFASDRGGTVGLWAVGIADGRPQGSPALIKPDIGSASMGVSVSGRLYSSVRASVQDISVASVDFATGTLVRGPARSVQSFVGFNSFPAWSPDGKYLAYCSTRVGHGPNTVLGIQSLATGEVRELHPKLAYFQQLRWAPDGQSLVAAGRDLKNNRPGAYRIDAQTGEATPVVVRNEVFFWLFAPQWSPDGSKLYYRQVLPGPDRGNSFSFVERDVVAGTERELWKDKTDFGAPFLSPDGRFIANVYNDGSTNSWVARIIAVSGGESRELLRVRQPQVLARSVAWMPDGRSILVNTSLNGSWEVGQYEVSLVPTTGGQPRKIDIGRLDASGITIHPDGRQIAFVAGENKSEVWVLENFLPTLITKSR